MATDLPKRRKSDPRTAAGEVQSVLKCKWSLAVLDQVASGVHRPGQITRAIPGLTTKVLNERLRKLVRYQVFERIVFAEVPPRVEYRLTPYGERFRAILDEIRALESSRPAQG